MILKWIFDRVMALVGLMALCWLYPAILIMVQMPSEPCVLCTKEDGERRTTARRS